MCTSSTQRAQSWSNAHSFRNTRLPRFQSTEGGVCMPARTISSSARQTPFLSASPIARGRPLRTAPASAWTAIGATCMQSSDRCPSQLPFPGADHRSRSRQQHAHHRAHDLGHSPPSRSSGAGARPPAGRLGVRVGRSAALRGPSEPARVPQGTPGNQNSARQRRSQHHTRTAGPARLTHACAEPRGACPHASATENPPLTNCEKPCSVSHSIAVLPNS